MPAENEDLGHSDRVEPSLDPTPDCRKERRCADYLQNSQSLNLRYENNGRLTNILSRVSG